jgi:hypothetical protein
MSTQEETSPYDMRAIGLARLAVGLAQGLALYLLYSAADAKVWPATDGLIFAPLLFVALFVPPIKAVSLGNLRIRTLVLWAVAATIVVAGLAWYDIWREGPLRWRVLMSGKAGFEPHIIPSFGVFFFTAAGLFIAQSLIAGGDADRRVIANYTTHFDVAWKLGLQLALSAVFVGIFWGLLALGAALFNLIGIDFFRRLIEHAWFAIPATTLAIAAAIHLTDVRAGLVRGARTLVLVLLAWLLPLMTIIAAGFLVTLIFVGLEPLWGTRHAAISLLTAAAMLVILINAAYQDGHAEREAPRILRYTGTLASLLLVPLVLISGYALLLRVRQYGWTTDRIASVACFTVAACYAAGYAAAALLPGPWLKRIEHWNFYAALLVLAVLLALFSPVADPARISVASQVARLEQGMIKPEKFDFDYLRWDSGRFGLAALRKLAAEGAGPEPQSVKSKAGAMLAKGVRYEAVPPSKPDLEANIAIYPSGRKLPATLLAHDWTNDTIARNVPLCLRYTGSKCDAFFVDLAGDGKEEILFLESSSEYNALFAPAADGSWHIEGQPGRLWSCDSVRAALRAGKFAFTAPQPGPWRDVEAGGVRLAMPAVEPRQVTCPK